MRALRLFFSSSQTVTQASALLAVAALFGNVLGLARNLVFYRFVRPEQLDIYFASFRVADFIFNLLIFGAITSAIIPVLTESISRHQEKEARQVTNQLLSWSTLFFVVLTVGLAIFMEPIIRIIVPGFEEDRLQTTVYLSRLVLIQTIFFSWSFILGGLLNGYRRFTTYALAPLFYNLSLITGGFLAATFGIKAITYSVLVGSFLHFLVQYREAVKLGFRPQFNLRLSPQIKEIVTLMLPRSLSQGMGQFVLISYTSLASGLQAGSIAIFSGMNDLQTTPITIIATSLATAFFPAISGHIAKRNWPEMNTLLSKVIRMALFLLLPTLSLALILRAQLVRLYFGIGGASWVLTSMAIDTFVWFMIGLIPAALVAIAVRVFYAFKDTRTPMRVTIATAFLGIAVAVYGIHGLHMNVSALAMAESVMAISQLVAFSFVLRKRQHIHIHLGQLSRWIITYLTGALLASLSSWITLQLVDLIYRQTTFLSTEYTLSLFLQLLLASLVGIGVYFGYSTLMSKEELQWIQRKNFFLTKE